MPSELPSQNPISYPEYDQFIKIKIKIKTDSALLLELCENFDTRGPSQLI